MLLRILCLLSLVLIFGSAGAQQRPELSGLRIEVATDSVLIHFDLNAAGGGNLSLTMQLSDDDGLNFRDPAGQLSGDIGAAVLPGTNRRIVWRYAAEDIGTGGNQYRIRLLLGSDRAIDLEAMLAEVDTLRLRESVVRLQGERHYQGTGDGLQEARRYIREELAAAGLRIRSQEFDYAGASHANLIGILPGFSQVDSIVAIGAHYDGVPLSPGADDNASGVAGVLEAARILSRYGFAQSFNFLLFDLEEAGLIGSREFVKEGIPEGSTISALYNFEMIGYYSIAPNSHSIPVGFSQLFPEQVQQVRDNDFRGDFIINVANSSSVDLMRSFVDAAERLVPALPVISLPLPDNGEIATDLRRSDHAPFWDAGYPALMLTDGANTRNPNYHAPTDHADSLNFLIMGQVVQATIAAAAEQAGVIYLDNVVSEAFSIVATGVAEESAVHSDGPVLSITPNPSSASTRFELRLPIAAELELAVYSSIGRHVATLLKGYRAAGNYVVNWDMQSFRRGRLSRGLYWCIIHYNNKRRVQPLVLTD